MKSNEVAESTQIKNLFGNATSSSYDRVSLRQAGEHVLRSHVWELSNSKWRYLVVSSFPCKLVNKRAPERLKKEETQIELRSQVLLGSPSFTRHTRGSARAGRSKEMWFGKLIGSGRFRIFNFYFFVVVVVLVESIVNEITSWGTCFIKVFIWVITNAGWLDKLIISAFGQHRLRNLHRKLWSKRV